MSDNYFVRKLLAVYFEWIPCVVVGYYFTRYGWFRYFERINTKLLCIFFILYLLSCYKFSVGYNSDWFSAIILVWLCMKAIHRIHTKVLVRLGKASMFIWFIHFLNWSLWFLYWNKTFPKQSQMILLTRHLRGNLISFKGYLKHSLSRSHVCLLFHRKVLFV